MAFVPHFRWHELVTRAWESRVQISPDDINTSRTNSQRQMTNVTRVRVAFARDGLWNSKVEHYSRYIYML